MKRKKCTIELIPVQSYKKDLVFLVTKTLKDITKNLFVKLGMVFYKNLSHLKPMSPFIPMLHNILEPSSCVRNLPSPPHKQIKKPL